MATAGYSASVLVSGTSTAMTDEATTQVGATKGYYITSLTKRILDPAVAVVVEDDATTVAASNYTVDHLGGRVTFAASYTVNAAVTVTASYLPTLEVGTARSYSLGLMRSMLDKTVFGDTATDRRAGLADCSGTLERLDVGTDDLDGGAGTVTLAGILAAGDYTLVKIVPDTGDTDSFFACWARLESDALSTDVADLVTASVSFQGVVPGNAAQSFWLGDTTA